MTRRNLEMNLAPSPSMGWLLGPLDNGCGVCVVHAVRLLPLPIREGHVAGGVGELVSSGSHIALMEEMCQSIPFHF